MPVSHVSLFVSHVSEDRAAALELVSELERRGVRCWIAPRDVAAGSPFDDEIEAAIQASRAMLLIFSERCNESEYIRREVTVAGESHKVIIPFRIEDAQPKRGLRVRLADLHWIDAFVERERAIDDVVRTVRPPTRRSQKSKTPPGGLPAAVTNPLYEKETDEQRFARLFAERPDVISEVEAAASRVPATTVADFERLLLHLEVCVRPLLTREFDERRLERILRLIEEWDEGNDAGKAFVLASRQPGVSSEEWDRRLEQYQSAIGSVAQIRDAIVAMGTASLPLVCVAFRRMNSCDAHNAVVSGFDHTWWIEVELLQVMSRLKDFRALPFIADAALRHAESMSGHNDHALAIVRAVRGFGADRETVDECLQRLVGVTGSEILRERRDRERD